MAKIPTTALVMHPLVQREILTSAHLERLARATSWADAGADTFVGLGQRLLATDKSDVALLDIRELVLDVAVEVEEAAGDG